MFSIEHTVQESVQTELTESMGDYRKDTIRAQRYQRSSITSLYKTLTKQVEG